MGGAFEGGEIGVIGAEDSDEGSDLTDEILGTIVGRDGGDLAIGGLLVSFFLELLV